MSGRAAKAARRADQQPAPAGAPLVAHRWANYKGDLSGSLGQVMGPNTLGEVAIAVECDYDAAANRSRVGFVLRPMPVVRRG